MSHSFDECDESYYSEYHKYITPKKHFILWAKDKFKSVKFLAKEKWLTEVFSLTGLIVSFSSFIYGSLNMNSNVNVGWLCIVIGLVGLCGLYAYRDKILRVRAEDRNIYLKFLHISLAHRIRSFHNTKAEKKYTSREIKEELKKVLRDLRVILIRLFRSHHFNLCIKFVFEGELHEIRVGKDLKTLQREPLEKVDGHYIFKRVGSLRDYESCVYFPDLTIYENDSSADLRNFVADNLGRYNTLMAFPVNKATRYAEAKNLEQKDLVIGFLGIDSKNKGLFGNLNSNVTHTIGCFVDLIFLIIREIQDSLEREKRGKKTNK